MGPTRKTVASRRRISTSIFKRSHLGKHGSDRASIWYGIAGYPNRLGNSGLGFFNDQSDLTDRGR